MSSRVLKVLLTASVLIFGAAANAQRPSGSEAAPAPDINKILLRMSETLAGTKEFSFRVRDLVDEVTDTGQKLQFSSTRQIAVRRPNQIAVEITGDLEEESVRYNRDRLTILDREGNVYCMLAVPDTIDETLDFLSERFDLTLPISDLLFSNPHGVLTADVAHGYYVGRHAIDGKPCHHLAFQHAGIDWQIWVEDDAEPLPRKMVITYKSHPGQPQYIAFLDQWNLSARFSESTFEIQIPDGAEKVDLQPVTEEDVVGSVSLPEADTKQPE